MRSLVSISLIAILTFAGAAYAEKAIIGWGGDSAELFGMEEDGAHITLFTTPEWDIALCSKLEFYCKRLGEPGDLYCNAVVFGPSEDETTMLGYDEGRYTVLARKLFKLAEVGEDAGWFSVEIDPIEMPPEFGVALFTFSSEDRVLLLGLSDPTDAESHSGVYSIGQSFSDSEEEEDKINVTTRTLIRRRGDGREWLIRAYVGSTISPEVTIDSSELISSKITRFDDGTADEYYTSQKHGPMLRIEGTSSRVVKRIYVHAKLEGEWFEATPDASVYLLDDELRILQRKKLPYANYATEPTWSFVEFDDIEVTPLHFLLVEPVSRPVVQMLIGGDTSGENVASLWGTAGSILEWASEAPEESTNWMIRVEYK